jgi:hypothetical protein
MLLTLLACATKVTWQVTPAPVVHVDTTSVAVAAEGVECRRVADAVVAELAARPGVRVEAEAQTRLVVRGCDQELSTLIEVENARGTMRVDETDRRRVVVEGQGTARVSVLRGTASVGELEHSAVASEDSGWASDGRVATPRARAVEGELVRLLARGIADDVAPLPADLQRRLFDHPEPGTAAELHNQAVAAEIAGDLELAMKLARQAWTADPSPRGARYLEQLEAHAELVGYAWAE